MDLVAAMHLLVDSTRSLWPGWDTAHSRGKRYEVKRV